MIKLPLVIPAYNRADTLGATLDSLRTQTCGFHPISEIILADDCSSDGTIDLARAACGESGLPLRVVTATRNLGQWCNMNRILESLDSNVEWVLLLHADDMVKPHWLSAMLTRIHMASATVATIGSSWDILKPDGSIVAGQEQPERKIELIKGSASAVRSTLFSGSWWCISGCALRLSAFRELGGFRRNLPYSADWEWLLRALDHGWDAEYIPRTLVIYRHHSESVSSFAFKTDADIREALAVVRDYVHTLSAVEVLRFHLRRFRFCLGRIRRGIANLDFKRILQATRSTVLVGHNLIRCLLRLSLRKIVQLPAAHEAR